MISVALIWIYIIITGYILGNSFLGLVGKYGGYRVKGTVHVLIAGFAVLTVYAQIFSLFYRVSALANIVLVILCTVLFIAGRKDIKNGITALKEECGLLRAIGMALLFLLFAYGTSHGYMHYDSDLYHAQSIRWIEEFGVIPGLGNLHTRLAYNCAAFPLTALFSFAFLKQGSFHVCQGLLAFLVFVQSIKIFGKESLKEPKLSFLPRIVAIYYILNIFDEMVSPASDYFVVLMVLYTVIAYVDLCDEGVEEYQPYALLCLACLYIATIKISAVLITLIVLRPLVTMVKEKRFVAVFGYIGTGLAVLFPFIARNIILSGYLVYPVPGIDVFNFDFKIPKGLAEYDSKEIQVFGRGHSDVSRFDEPLRDWIFDWFKGLDAVNKGAFLLGLVSIVILVFILIYAVMKKKKEWLSELIIVATVDLSFAFFIMTSPNIRYCCVFLYLAPVLTLGFVYFRIISGRDRMVLYRIALCAFVLYKGFTFSGELVHFVTPGYLIGQQGYGEYELVRYELHGIDFYYPQEGDRTGYDLFPAAPLKAEDIFRGESIKDGFMDVVHTEER
ncbi:MAG: hypothetical protein K5888_01650 [Lachnospiraceae bacterium]|nr:hypothetical protein [Lachnospiraceae bacterium]